MASPNLTRAINRFTAAAIGLQKTREKEQIARSHLLTLEKVFEDQYHLLMFRFQFMQEYFDKEPVRLMEAKRPANPDAMKRWDDIWKDVETKTTKPLQDVVKNIESEAMVKGADQLKTQMRFDAKGTFSLTNPRAVAWMRKNGGSVELIAGIQKTTADSLKRVITTGLDSGWSYNTTAREIRKLFDGPITTDRARLIAVTESARAYEAGSFMFEQELQADGVELEKQWEDSKDNRVSDGCLENSAAGYIPLDEPFPSGDMFPPRFPGCRCWHSVRQVRS